tara:strand:- start:1213 stop:1395 length:183 start_codon:yes stop_codon:yes gene_type:complete
MKFDYKIEHRNYDNLDWLTITSREIKFLKEEGQAEWELIHIETNKNSYEKTYYFKKKINE